MRKSIWVLLAILAFAVWHRARTFGPTVGLGTWPAAASPSEPLDCDEAIYAHMGRRILAGDVLYRDLTENKPPLGYWLYAGGVALLGYDEVAIRILPIPFVLATIAAVWWVASRFAGPFAGGLSALLAVVLTTDPYLFGNGSNMEHFMNAFSTVALALMVLGWDRGKTGPFVAAGVALGAATLVKQVAVVPMAAFGIALLARRSREGLRHAVVLAAAFGVALAAAALVLWLRGAGWDAYVDIVQFGRAMATDVAPEPGAPSGWIRWLTGNADPKGILPPPFGNTDYLVWWAGGSWPAWLALAPCLLHLAFAPTTTPARRLAAGWIIASLIEVSLPGMYWPHYYLLAVPGAAIALGVTAGDCLAGLRSKLRLADLGGLGVVVAATIGTVGLQVRDYLLVPPQELTVRFKGGGQWVVLRDLGRELNRRRGAFADPRLFAWGWQSPLFFYGKLDHASRHLFVDNLLRDYADKPHPLISPRVAEIMDDLRATRPPLIFVGYPPFPALRDFLMEGYLPSKLVPGGGDLGLWVARESYSGFENFDGPGTAGPLKGLSGREASEAGPRK